MSADATRWAWQQQLDSRSKLLLLSLSDRAGEDDTCWPSWARLSFDTGLDRKTVNSCLMRLTEAGLIRDTGRRVGRTKKVVVWRLVGVPHREEGGNSPKKGTVPFFPGNSPEKGTVKQSQKRNSEPTFTKPKKEPTTTSGGSVDVDFPLDIQDLKGALETVQHADLSPELAQIVIDELAGQIRVGAARFPSRLLNHLIKKAKSGEIERTSWGRKIAEEREAARRAAAAEADLERRRRISQAAAGPAAGATSDGIDIISLLANQGDSAEVVAALSRIRAQKEKLVATTHVGDTCFQRKETEDAVHGS
ncbi:helix-turn-helix domain-containing protein [Thiomonas sp.]